MKTPTRFLSVLKPVSDALRLGAVSALALYATAAQAVLLDFNTPGQMADESHHAGAPTLSWVETATGGLGNSGWAKTQTSTGSSARYSRILNDGFAGNTGSFTLSIYFQWQTPNLGSSGDLLMLGVGRSTDSGVAFEPFSLGTNNAALQELQFGIRTTGSGSNAVRLYASSMADGVVTNTSHTPQATLTVGNWYYLQLEYSLTPGGDGYTVETGLYESSNLGVVGGALSTWSLTQTNAKLTAGDVNAYFTARNGYYSGITGVDNFAVSIPEPSVVWTAGTAALLALGWRRMRQS